MHVTHASYIRAQWRVSARINSRARNKPICRNKCSSKSGTNIRQIWNTQFNCCHFGQPSSRGVEPDPFLLLLVVSREWLGMGYTDFRDYHKGSIPPFPTKNQGGCEDSSGIPLPENRSNMSASTCTFGDHVRLSLSLTVIDIITISRARSMLTEIMYAYKIFQIPKP